MAFIVYDHFRILKALLLHSVLCFLVILLLSDINFFPGNFSGGRGVKIITFVTEAGKVVKLLTVV